MGRTIVRCYLDVVISNPDLTLEEREDEINRLEEESEQLTDWTEIL